MKRTKKYDDSLIASLKDPKEAAAYLNTHLEEEGRDSEELFLMALRDVAKAYGIAEIADKTQFGRESLYKALSPSGNPKLTTLRQLLQVMGLKLSVKIAKKIAS